MKLLFREERYRTQRVSTCFWTFPPLTSNKTPLRVIYFFSSIEQDTQSRTPSTPGEREQNVQPLSRGQPFKLLLLLYCLLILCVCGHTYPTCLRSGDSLWESALTFHNMGSGNWTQVTGCGSKCLYTLSHLVCPICGIMFLCIYRFSFHTNTVTYLIF